ncbi:MAG: HAD family hydrolase [Deltaproteobacteria bacterium]|nr:HAD family hydrolase [Deltaproteobacteria bacterium]
MRRNFCVTIALAAVLAAPAAAAANDALSSWNDGRTKQAIVQFVEEVTTKGGPKFVHPAERIAVFDNDGTLWAEQPIYFQLAFALDRVKALVPQHPEWKDQEPFKSALADDLAGVAAGGEKGLLALIAATHGGMTSAEFDKTVKEWVAAAKHPRFQRPYTDLVYQPMLELLAYLRANDFKTYIVSGGGIEFVRAFAEPVYGVPPEQVIGSSVKTRYEVRDGRPVIERLPEIDFIDDKAGKPVGIHKFIGRRPLMAFGNSDGDFEMLEWTTSGPGPRFALIVHHDDAVREWAYDRESPIGRLNRGLDEGPQRGWVIASMQRDWQRVYAFEKK